MLRALPLFILLLPSLVYGQAFKGVSAFGAMNPAFPCEEYLSILESSPMPAMAVLYGTFGSDWTCVSKFIDKFKDQPHLIEVHLVNGPCHKNRRCEATDYEPTLTREQLCGLIVRGETGGILALADEVASKLSRYAIIGKTHMVISPILEESCSGRIRPLYDDLVKRRDYWVVFHAMKGGDFLEVHNYSGPNTFWVIANEDGLLRQDYGKSQRFLRKYNRTFAVFFWRPWTNGLPKSGRFVPYGQRDFQIPKGQARELRRLLAGK